MLDFKHPVHGAIANAPNVILIFFKLKAYRYNPANPLAKQAMNLPRLFISAVSDELKTARKSVADTARNLGYECVSQDDFPTGHGELKHWLRQQIDSCEGLVQIVGVAYGAEPAQADADFGRLSYTQYEFRYARQQHKKTWVIIAGEHCQRDKPIAELDLPKTSHPDPESYQSQRKQLQQDYIAWIKAENHLRHTASSDYHLKLLVHEIKPELEALRQQWQAWLAEDAEYKAKTIDKLDEITEHTRITTAKIRAHLLETIATSHQRELAQAEQAKTWQDRQRLREAAEAAHLMRAAKVDELAATIADIEGQGNTTSVYQEMTRILAEQGVDEAIAFVTSQENATFNKIRARKTAAQDQYRAELQPFLQTAALHENKGQAEQARALYTKILDEEPDWPEALHAYFWFLTDQGDMALRYFTLSHASKEYREAQTLALRLTTNDPRNSDWQRDLSVSYHKLGDVAKAQGDLEAAARAFRDGLAIGSKLADSDPRNSQWQRDLSVSYNKLGDVAIAQGDLDAAADAYRNDLAITIKLADSDPRNSDWQRDLSVSYDRLGNVAITQGDLDAATDAYRDGLAIRSKLEDSDPRNSQW